MRFAFTEHVLAMTDGGATHHNKVEASTTGNTMSGNARQVPYRCEMNRSVGAHPSIRCPAQICAAAVPAYHRAATARLFGKSPLNPDTRSWYRGVR